MSLVRRLCRRCLFCLSLLLLCIKRIKVDRRQHKRWEAALDHKIVYRFARVREQDVWANCRKQLRKLLLAEVLCSENAGLLNFNDKSWLLFELGFDRENENNLVDAVLHFLAFRFDVEIDLWLPLALEYKRAARRFERCILEIDALQGELRGSALLVSCSCSLGC